MHLVGWFIWISLSSLDGNTYSCFWIKVVTTHNDRCTFSLESLQNPNIMVKHYSWTTWPQPSKRIATSHTGHNLRVFYVTHSRTRSNEVHVCFRFFACKLAVKSRSAVPLNNVLTRWGANKHHLFNMCWRETTVPVTGCAPSNFVFHGCFRWGANQYIAFKMRCRHQTAIFGIRSDCVSTSNTSADAVSNKGLLKQFKHTRTWERKAINK